MPKIPSLCFITLGCKTNQFETQAMELICLEKGAKIISESDNTAKADIYIINSCAVTSSAGAKSRRELHRARRANPEAVIAVCGCYSKLAGDALISSGEADIVGGNRDHRAFLDEVFLMSRERLVEEEPDEAGVTPRFELLPAGSLAGRTRALLKIEDGCDNFCAYCIIPYLRGRVRSISPGDALREALRLQNEGYAEIVLTGIEIASYGKDLVPACSLTDLIVMLGEKLPNTRLRLGSLEPRTVNIDFCTRLSRLPSLCHHFHLSLQSGCDDTLRRMGRKYTTSEFAASVALLREYFPDAAITTDIICGFPGESDRDAEMTENFCRSCRFDRVHLFPYSSRSGTRAAKLAQLTRAVKEERAAHLGVICSEITETIKNKQIGKEETVLFESEKDGLFSGYTGNYRLVYSAEKNLKGKVKKVRLTGIYSDGFSCDILD